MTGFLLTSLTLLLQSTGLLLLGLLSLWLTRRHGPTIQTLIGRATLSGIALLLLLAPLSSHVQPVWRIPTPAQAPTLPKREGEEFRTDSVQQAPMTYSESTANKEEAANKADATSSAPKPQSFPTSTPPRPPVSGGPLRSNLLQSKEVGSHWLTLSLTFLFWLAACQWHLTRLRRTATTITSGPALSLLTDLTPHPLVLLTHKSVHSPFLAGLHRPAIFLPVSYETEFDTTALRAILAHELAHRDRRDNAGLFSPDS
ncbi:MAG: M56 family metallopeptidase [Janthinobacterium lividum]